MFKNVPIQVRKCRLLNTICLTQAHISKATQFGINWILNRNCQFYIHENLDPLHFDSLICTVRPCETQIDMASALISHGAAIRTSSCYLENIKKANESAEVARHLIKRIRKDCDEHVIKSSSELRTFDDFVLFFNMNQTIIPPIERKDSPEDDRPFEVFDPPCNKSPSHEKRAPASVSSVNPIVYEPHPILAHIEKHFSPRQLKESIFHCQTLFVIDPVTILVKPVDVKPPSINIHQHQSYTGILPGLFFKMTENCLKKIKSFIKKLLFFSQIIHRALHFWITNGNAE